VLSKREEKCKHPFEEGIDLFVIRERATEMRMITTIKRRLERKSGQLEALESAWLACNAPARSKM